MDDADVAFDRGLGGPLSHLPLPGLVNENSHGPVARRHAARVGAPTRRSAGRAAQAPPDRLLRQPEESPLYPLKGAAIREGDEQRVVAGD